MCLVSHKVYSKNNTGNMSSYLHDEVSNVNTQLETYDLSSRKRRMRYTDKHGKVGKNSFVKVKIAS